MCRLALMDNAGIRYMQKNHNLEALFDYLERHLGGHGNGICFIYKDGRYSIKKGLFLTNKEIVADITSQIDNLKWIIYHSRLAGAATINNENCHPFEHNGRVMAMNGNETDYTVVDDSLTDTENILRTTPNITEGTRKFKSVFLGYENGKVFANKNAFKLECILPESGGLVFASRFPLYYHEIETVYEAPAHYVEGDELKDLEISKTEVGFHYGNGKISHTFKNAELFQTLTSSINTYDPGISEAELIENAMKNPIDSPSLRELSKGKNKVVIIASDHTRPVPSKLIIPPMLREIREGNPDADITILIATGCHRGTTKDELIAKFGEDIVRNEKICIHDCDDEENLKHIRTLPSGSACKINKLALDADLLVAEGFIEPHFFAGFSGGRKSVLPGIAGRNTVLNNHCSSYINHKRARTGILKDNPIHEDMLLAAKNANLAYIVNVVINAEKKVIYAVAGNVETAHKEGCNFLSKHCEVFVEYPSDVVISTNGGYPLDQNVYQAVKGMTAAEAAVRQGGVIIMLARSNDGIGGDHFYHQLADEADINKTMATFLARGKDDTAPDQWQTQILLRVLKKAKVIYISDMDDEIIEKMHMIPAKNIDEALKLAKLYVRKDEPSIIAIPDGVSVIVKSN